jgi:hypothetical protein
MQASIAPQELNRIVGVDKTCDFVKVGYIADQVHVYVVWTLLFFQMLYSLFSFSFSSSSSSSFYFLFFYFFNLTLL